MVLIVAFTADVSFGDAVMDGRQHLTQKEIPTEGIDSKKSNALATSIFDSLLHDKKPSNYCILFELELTVGIEGYTGRTR